MNNEDLIVELKQVTNICETCHARELCMTSSLNEDDLTRFNDHVVHHSPIARGKRFFMAGEAIQSLFILHSGSVKTYIESQDGDSQITGFHLPGDIIGIHGVENQVHSDTVEALETSSVCEVKLSNFAAIRAVFPNLEKPLMRYVFREMSHEQLMLLVLGKMSAERRVAHFLLDISSRLENHGLSPNNITLTMTRHDIGNYLGLAVETVSRILTRFRSKKMIDVERRSIHIRDKQSLECIYENSVIAENNHQTQ